jgi:hypothetical protein
MRLHDDITSRLLLGVCFDTAAVAAVLPHRALGGGAPLICVMLHIWSRRFVVLRTLFSAVFQTSCRGLVHWKCLLSEGLLWLLTHAGLQLVTIIVCWWFWHPMQELCLTLVCGPCRICNASVTAAALRAAWLCCGGTALHDAMLQTACKASALRVYVFVF